MKSKDFKCYFCRSSKYRTLKSGGIFYICRNCGLITLSEEERLKDSKDYYSNTYYPEGFSGRNFLKSAFSYRLPIISRFIKEGSEVLEIGAASGDFSNILKQFGYKVSGVELSERAVLKAKENYNLDLFCGDLKEACFQNNKFNAIVMYHVIEHIDDPRSLLQEIKRILKIGGIAIIEVPNPKSIDGHLSKKLLASILDYPNHTYAFPRAVLESIIEEAGLEIIYAEKSFSYLLFSIFKRFFKRKDQTSGPEKGLAPKEENINWGSIKDYKSKGSFKRFLANLLPGMKFSIVARKRVG